MQALVTSWRHEAEQWRSAKDACVSEAARHGCLGQMLRYDTCADQLTSLLDREDSGDDDARL